jgi:hypothetical protein
MAGIKEIKIRPHNLIARCTVCEIWLDAKTAQMYMVSTPAAVQPTPDGAGIQIQTAQILICQDCFSGLELKETPDPSDRLIIPGVRVMKGD